MKHTVLALCLLLSPAIRSQHRVDSLWAAWNNARLLDTVRMQAGYLICRDYYAYSKPDTALIFLGTLYQMADQRHMKHFAGKVLNGRMAAFINSGQYDSALVCGRRALVLLQEAKYYVGIAAVAENIGAIYMKRGDNHRALDLYFKSRRLKEHVHDSARLVSSLVNIAAVYGNMGRFDSARHYHEQALVIAERHSDRSNLFAVVANLGNLYQRAGQMDKAFVFYERAIKLAEEFGSGIRLASVYDALLGYYRLKQDFKKALECQEKSMAIYKHLNNRLAIAESMHMLSTIYYYMGQLEKARVTGEEAIKMLGSEKLPAFRRDMYSDLANVYYNQKKFEKAIRYNLRFVALRDSIRNDSLTNIAIAEETRSRSQTKELLLKAEADKRLMTTRAEAERSNQRKNTWIMVSVALLVILGLSAYFSYRHWRQKNIIADQENKLLNEKLLASQMNPHFIFNSLNAIQNFIFRQDNYLAGIYLKQFSELMRMILEFSRREYISLEEEYRFLVSYLDLQKLRFDGKLDYSIVIDERLDRDSVLIPPMLGQPFAENAIEHGILHVEGQGKLTIRIVQEQGLLVYEIEDNGIGLAAAKSWKKTHHRSLATDITRERLTALHREHSEKNDLKIIDKNLLAGMGSGVIVKFTIP